MTEQLMKFVADKLFQYLEQKAAGVPLLPDALEKINGFVDDDMIKWLVDEARAAGFVLPE